MFGYVVGSMASLVGKLSLSASQHRDKMMEITQYMLERKLSMATQQKVRHFYAHYLARKSAFDENAILDDLSASLRQEVVMCLNGDVVSKIELFAGQVSVVAVSVASAGTRTVLTIPLFPLLFSVFFAGHRFHCICCFYDAARVLCANGLGVS